MNSMLHQNFTGAKYSLILFLIMIEAQSQELHSMSLRVSLYRKISPHYQNIWGTKTKMYYLER